MPHSDVCIVGGGAIGAACAYELARRGASVRVIERGSTLASGCSSGNAGLLCPSHSAPLTSRASFRHGIRWLRDSNGPFSLRLRPSFAPWLMRFALACTPSRERAASDLIRRLSVESVALHSEFADAGLEYGFGRRGIVNVYESDAGLAAGLKEASEGAIAGLRYQLLSPIEAMELVPTLDVGLSGAILHPDEAHADPLLYVQQIGQAAADAGAQIQLRTEVLGLRVRRGRVVRIETSADTLTANDVVLAAGAWTGRLARTAGVFVPLEGGKGYHVDFPASDSDPQLPVFLHETHVVVTPLKNTLRLTGALELGGLDLGINERRLHAIQRAAAKRVMGLTHRPSVELWAGLRPCSPDGLPLIGRTHSVPNLVVATGHATMGFTLAPVTGRLVADIVVTGRNRDDLNLINPNRFRPLFFRGKRTLASSEAVSPLAE